MKARIIEAIESKGYSIFDGRFIEELGHFGLLTVAWNNINDIEIVEGDFEDFYRNSYKYALLLNENTDLDKIEFQDYDSMSVEDKIYKLLKKSVTGDIDTSVIDEFLEITDNKRQKVCGDGSHDWAFELYRIEGTNLYALEMWADGSGINCYKIYDGKDRAIEEFAKEWENLNNNFDWNLSEFGCE